LWDGTPTCCHHNAKGHLINPSGQIICTDWQCPFGCHAKHLAIHKCSSCRVTSHDAQACPRAQKS
ncbi:hypothetical protein BS17DRAFT_692340, partial [Gyrodon lividus]